MSMPNIILIMVDNQQAATLGCYGNPEVHSPHIDALAAAGTRFDNAACPNAMCSPCRASVLTGMMPSGHGVHSWIDDRNMDAWPAGWHALRGLPTLPELLQARGYATGLFGKYHLGETASAAPGWDRWVTMTHGHVRSFYGNEIIEDGAVSTPDGHAVDIFTDRLLRFTAAQDGPYFAYLPLPAPYGHWPSTNDGARNRHAARYDDCPCDSIPREGLSAEAVTHYDQVKAHSGGGLDFSMLLRAPNHLPTLRNYFSQITLIDEAVGRIAAAAPDAIIVYTADHGLSLGQHGFWGHGSATYPSNMHRAAHSIPMIVRLPGGRQVPVSPRMVSNLDLFATLLDLAGAAPDPDLPSRSFADALRGAEIEDDAVFSEQEETRVLRTRDWLYFRRFNRPGSPPLADALYDLRADPGETRNLIDAPEHAETAAGLAARIDAFFARHARPEADLWRGGRPIQNTLMGPFWREAWGADWAPVYAYD